MAPPGKNGSFYILQEAILCQGIKNVVFVDFTLGETVLERPSSFDFETSCIKYLVGGYIYGSHIKLDRLADLGTRFVNFNKLAL